MNIMYIKVGNFFDKIINLTNFVNLSLTGFN